MHNVDLCITSFFYIETDCENLSMFSYLLIQGFTPPMLVFVQSIERAKELFHELVYDGLNIDVIHSERTQSQRDNVVKCFRSGKVSTIMNSTLANALFSLDLDSNMYRCDGQRH